MGKNYKFYVSKTDKSYSYYIKQDGSEEKDMPKEDIDSDLIGDMLNSKDSSSNFHYVEEKDRGNKQWNMIWVSVHEPNDLLPPDDDQPYDFEQSLLLTRIKDDDGGFEKKFPILHISQSDAYVGNLYRNEKLPADVRRYFQIMDNSIWNYLLPATPFVRYEDGSEIKIQVLFEKAIESIIKNYKNKLYDLKIAHEYSDLNARITKESYLYGDHAEGVSPFIFHSESAIKQLIQKEFESTNKKTFSTINEIKKFNWRILLVDDKSESKLENIDNTKTITKSSIIERLFEKVFCNKTPNDDYTIKIRPYSPKEDSTSSKDSTSSHCILIEYAENLYNASSALKQKEYDIVLLDYLLKNSDNTFDYGHELLDDIYKHQDYVDSTTERLVTTYNAVKKLKDNVCLQMVLKEIYNDISLNLYSKYIKGNNVQKDLEKIYDSINIGSDNCTVLEEKIVNLFKCLEKYKVGPCDRFFFMFISAYSSAVYERLLAEGLNQSEDYWHIAVGACPTNTPQLFLYNLIKLMEKRLEDSHIKKLSINGIINSLKEIYNQKGHVRKNAGEHYQEIQSYQYYYRTILKDYKVLSKNDSIFDTQGSVLMTDFMNRNINLGGLLEHMAQLVYLTAFGTVRQWPEMWEEYIYFKSLLSSQIESDNREFDDLGGNIENYIKSLKSSTL